MHIRILYLHHVGQIGGAEHSLHLLFKHLDPNLVIPFFGGPTAGAFPERLAKDGISMFPISFGPLRNVPRLLSSVKRVCDLIREHHIHLLHSNGPQTNLCAGLAGRLTKTPVIWHMRNLLRGDMHDVDRMFSRLPTKIICNSHAVQARFKENVGWTKSVTIHNAIDRKEFSQEISGEPFRQEFGLTSSEVAIGMIGRLDPNKGQESFVQAAIALLHENICARFFMVGEAQSPEEFQAVDRLQQHIRELGYEEAIVFTGFRTDIPSVMRGLDILVLTSEFEACGRVLVEAMATGTAIVASNSGGTPEIVREGREGLLVPPQDPHALVGAIRCLIKNSDLRKSLGQGGVTRVQEEFTIDRYVRRTMKVYAEALEEFDTVPHLGAEWL